VTYFETLEADFDEYTERQRRNHFLHRLRKDFRKKINSVVQIPETRDTLVTLTQRIKNTILSRSEILNKISERELFFESRNFRESFYSRRQEKTVSTNKIRDISATASCRESTSKLSLCNSEKISETARDKRICYNCEEKKYIARDCSKSSKKTQINAVENFWSSSASSVQKTLSPRFIIEEVSDKSEN